MKLLKNKTKDKATVPPPTPVTGTAGSLREFVYLDEVSVYSLTSSPDLPPPVSMSESANNSAGEVLAAQIDAGSPVLLKSSLKGELNSARSTGLEVQRQFNIQSQFARLHQLYKGTFALTATHSKMKAKTTDDLATALSTLETEQRAIRADNLNRGTLVELRVALRAHPVFDIAAFTRTAGSLIKTYPELLQVPDLSEIKQGMDAGEFLNELMEDLVPIEGRSTTYELVTDPDGHQWVAHIPSLQTVFGARVESEPLRVVGVAEKDSFWKDIRRILHADAEFDILGRVSRAGIRTDWSPVKLTDSFKRVVPEAAEGLIEAIGALKNIAKTQNKSVDASTTLVIAATMLQHDLAVHHNVTSTGLSEVAISTLLTATRGLEGQLAALSTVAELFYAKHTNLDRQPEAVATLRQQAWRSAHLLADIPQDPPPVVDPEPLALELEFIAMYW